jgi:hypothetical protein
VSVRFAPLPIGGGGSLFVASNASSRQLIPKRILYRATAQRDYLNIIKDYEKS